MIKIQSDTATRAPLPPFLRGLSRDSLADLSWTDPALGLQDCAWWPEVNESEALPDELHRYGAETLIPDAERRVVVVTREILPPTAEEKAAALSQAKAQALERLNAAYNAAIHPLIRTYPDIERETWPEQKAEAQAYQAWADAGSVGDAPATPVLDEILAGRNGADGTETIGELVGKVLANVKAFTSAQNLTGVRHRGERLIAAAETMEAVQAVTWEGLTA